MRRASMLLGLFAASACLPDALTPETGAQVAASCDDQDSDPATPVSFHAEVQPLLEEYCFRCHTPTGSSPIGVEVGGLDMSSYASLRAGGVVSRSRIIVPESPCQSLLIDKVNAAPSFGARMPLSGPPFLEEDELQLLHDWIAEGARED